MSAGTKLLSPHLLSITPNSPGREHPSPSRAKEQCLTSQNYCLCCVRAMGKPQNQTSPSAPSHPPHTLLFHTFHPSLACTAHRYFHHLQDAAHCRRGAAFFLPFNLVQLLYILLLFSQSCSTFCTSIKLFWFALPNHTKLIQNNE